LLVLRQDVAILRRQVNRPQVKPEERILLAVLQRLQPAWERTSSLVTPDTLRRWHRELIRRKWNQPHRGEPEESRLPTDPAAGVALVQGESVVGLPAHQR
jgi:hypothetical protein